jgi:hypothetical protein
MMYAIVKNVTMPPRTSRPTVDPRALISKKRSSREPDAVVSGPSCGDVAVRGDPAGPDGRDDDERDERRDEECCDGDMADTIGPRPRSA